MRYCTCHRIELAPLQNDSEHEDELRGALRERLYEPQHAEIVGQVHCIVLGPRELREEAAH